MNKRAIGISYTQSLLWIALCFALVRVEAFVVELLLVDFVHGNPHRPRENAIFMIKAFTPGLAFIAIAGTFLVFALSQFFQVELIGAFEPKFGDRARSAPLLALPVTAVLTWYCYDYLTPSNLCFAGNCMPAYEHGISAARYLTALTIQVPITLFSLCYFNAGLCERPKIRLVLSALATAIVVGLIRGYLDAGIQYQFLGPVG